MYVFMSAIFTYVEPTRLMNDVRSVSTEQSFVITACKTSCVLVLSETVKHPNVYSVFGFWVSSVVSLVSIVHIVLTNAVR